MKEKLRFNDVPVHARAYNVAALTEKGGCIQFIPGTRSLKEFTGLEAMAAHPVGEGVCHHT